MTKQLSILVVLALLGFSPCEAKDNPKLPIHAWCMKGTPQWPSCVPKGYKANHWEGWFSVK